MTEEYGDPSELISQEEHRSRAAAELAKIEALVGQLAHVDDPDVHKSGLMMTEEQHRALQSRDNVGQILVNDPEIGLTGFMPQPTR